VLIVDIDLSILGQSAQVFDSYETSIRAEYSWVPETVYVAGRTKILTSFLDRPRVYFTERFENMYGPQAKLNLTRALSILRLPRKGE
jgi:predicted metal-dependent HD superfamily phosphohydrolase